MPMEYISFFVGAGFPDESLANAQGLELDFIGADAGTIDVGPYQLAGQGTIFSEALCRHDLRRALLEARRRDIPLVIGSCGGSGTDWGVDWFAGMVRDIARESALAPFRVARIYSELDRDYLRNIVHSGRIHPLAGPELPFSDREIDNATCIAGVMGVEPFIAALEAGADVILAGRATDSAIFAALPLLKGYPEAIAWHAAKVAECGGAIAEPARNDLLQVVLDHDGFTVRPMNAQARCTPWSVAAHQLYENADPFRFTEPSGTLDATDVTYTEGSDRSVTIRGATFEPARQYTMKLEGVEPAGYQSIALASYNDPVLLDELPVWLESARREVEQKIQRVYGTRDLQATLNINTYGAGNAADLFSLTQMSTPGSDVLFLIDVVAPTQEVATSVCTIAWHTLVHYPPSGWSGSFVNAAWPFNPPVIERGLMYRFNVNHAIEVDAPLEAVRIQYEEIG